MDRNQFIDELRKRLMSLPYDEREKAISYYEEYFDDADIENKENVMYELGDIDRIAQEILENSTSGAGSLSVNKFTAENDYEKSDSFKLSSENQNRSYDSNFNNSVDSKPIKKTNKKLSSLMIVLIIIGAFACFPIILSIFGVVMGFVGVVIGLIASAFGIAISGIATLISLPFVGLSAVGTILFYLGKGLLSLTLFIVIIAIAVKLIKMIVEYFRDRKK